jgi:D-glycero-alpha-D-manno-heptose-7-phosphate kinase
MVEAAIKSVGVPDKTSVKVNIYSEVPPGASTGTSAAVSVALIGGLLKLSGRDCSPTVVAHMAHEVETKMLGLQSGIQDQLCSAHGGVRYIDMYEFPKAVSSQLDLSIKTLYELDRRLVLIFLGKSHSSSKIHDLVIKELESSGPDCEKIRALRRFAPVAAEALLEGDLSKFGLLMTENTYAQAALSSLLVSEDAWYLMKVAERHGALGCKVNGAGGEGGSVTILCDGDYRNKRNMISDIMSLYGKKYQYIPTHISNHGVCAWES